MSKNNINKLYLLKLLSTNKIIAITEYKYHMRLFILQNEYSQNDYTIEILTKEKEINKYLIKYTEDLYLIEYKDFIIRSSDKRYIDEIMYNTKNTIRNTVNQLESINLTCILSPEEHTKIGEIINLLYNKSKKKNIDEFINTHQIIKDFCNNHNMKYDLQELNDRYYKFLEEDT